MKNTLFLFLVGCLLFSGCKNEPKTELKTESITFTKEGELKIIKSDSLLINLDIEIADTEYETQTGMMYRKSMNEKEGMLFIFPDVSMRSFYMKNTEIPLDIIYIGEDLKIVSMQQNAKPFDETSLPSEAPAKYVLEINGGLSEKWSLKAGDSISFTKIK